MSKQRLIDANALLEELDESIGKMIDWAAKEPVCSPVYNMLRNKLDEREHFRNMIIKAPTVEERPKGKWIYRGLSKHTKSGDNDVERYECSICGNIEHGKIYRCPWCLNDMECEEI